MKKIKKIRNQRTSFFFNKISMSDAPPPGIGIEPGNPDLKSKGLVTTLSTNAEHQKLMESFTNAVDDMLGTFPVDDEDEELGEEQPPGLHVEEIDPPGLTTVSSDITPTMISKSGSSNSVESFGIPPGITKDVVSDEQEEDENLKVIVMSIDPMYPPPDISPPSKSDVSKEYDDDDDDEVEPVPPETFSVLEPSQGTPADIVVRKKRDEKIPIESAVHVQHTPSEPSPRLQRDHGVSAHTHHSENALRDRLSRMQATQNDSDERIKMLNQIHAREIETMLKRIEEIQFEGKEREDRLERKFEAAQAYSAKLMRHINEKMSPREKADERYALEKQVIELKQHVDLLKDKLLSRGRRVFRDVDDDDDDDDKQEETNVVVESVDPLYPPSRKKLERRIDELTRSLHEAQTRIGQQSLVIRGLQDHLRIFASKSNNNNDTKLSSRKSIENNVTAIVRRKQYDRRIVVREILFFWNSKDKNLTSPTHVRAQVHTTPSSSLDEIEKETSSLAKFCTKMMRSRRRQNDSSVVSVPEKNQTMTSNKRTNFPPVPLQVQKQQYHHILPDSDTRRQVMNSVLDFNDDFGPRLSEDEVREIVSRSTMGFVDGEFQEEEKDLQDAEKKTRSHRHHRLIDRKSRRPSRKWHYTNAHR